MTIIPNWKPYPETKPEKSGIYSVTLSYKTCDTDYRHFDFDMRWSSKHEAWNACDSDESPKHALKNVVAWTECLDIAPYMVSDGLKTERTDL